MTDKGQCRCPHCHREWEGRTEQHACIELFGECIPCRFVPGGRGSGSGGDDDLEAIRQLRKKMLGLPPITPPIK